MTKAKGEGTYDWAERLDVWLWLAYLVMKAGRLDVYEMAELIFGDRKRRQQVERIWREGQDPERLAKVHYGRSLVEEINQKPGFEGSADYYHTPLCKLLKGPRPAPEYVSAELERLSGRYHLRRITPYSTTVRTKEPRMTGAGRTGGGRLERDQDFFRRYVSALAFGASIDDIYVCALHYRQALDVRDYGDLLLFEQALLSGVFRFCETLRVPVPVAHLLRLLVRRRIILDDWAPIKLDHTTRTLKAEAEKKAAARAAKAERDRGLVLEMARGAPKTRRPDRMAELTWLVAQEVAHEMRARARWMPFQPRDETGPAIHEASVDRTWRFSLDEMMAVDWDEFQGVYAKPIPRMFEGLLGDYPADLKERTLKLQERVQAAMAWPAVESKPA